ncbi:hypothetical protein [Cellulomonas sp.]|uniref:hypothetical protein n=1 Tax=Cellulomonas sp. TaxID=40001 RepID=UPI003BAB028A
MPRFHAPPNWPRPPEGWTPPPGWLPDPSWGPVPDGWQLWVHDPGENVRPNRDAFVRTGIMAVVAVVLAIVLTATTAGMSSYGAGYVTGQFLFPYLITSLIVFFQRRKVGWPSHIVIFIGIVAVCLTLSQAGARAGGM